LTELVAGLIRENKVLIDQVYIVTNLSTNNTTEQRVVSKKTERIVAVLALVTIVAAWMIGSAGSQFDLEPVLSRVMPQAERFEKLDSNTYAVYMGSPSEELVGYVTTGEANGFAGPLKVAVAVDLQGEVLALDVVDQRETPAWFKRVKASNLLGSLTGKNYTDSFQINEDIDVVTGATFTTRAIAESVLNGSRRIAVDRLGFEEPTKTAPRIIFGLREGLLVLLFVFGIIAHRRDFPYTKQVRRFSLLVGLVALGFLYNSPLSLAYINKFLLGFWPQWQTNLYWYLLIGGILLVFVISNRNPYCHWFCPFGAVQECAGAVGGKKIISVSRYRRSLQWLTRTIVWLSIVLALLLRSPGLTGYEVFDSMFTGKGSSLQFILLGIVLLAALVIRMPWCTYFCPITPVMDFSRIFRKWVIEIWEAKQL
jgi:NosR/NirI family nitrous oxide reductase transcriptional regulator